MRVPRVGRFVFLGVVILGAVSLSAQTSQFVCSSIQPGDTAWSLALRLTGNAANRHEAWFQIVDPATRTFIPKSRYKLLSTRWQACLARDMPGKTANPRVAVREPAARTQYNFNVGWRVGLAVASMLLAFSSVTRYVAQTRPVPEDLRRAGEAFVIAFARPLIQPFSSDPIEVRLRFLTRLDALEILIAPGTGRRYPNLSDHKKNLEYDVQRVLQILRDELVLADRIRAEGRWVVIPVRRNADLKRQVTSEHSSPQFGRWRGQHPALAEGAVCDGRRPGAQERREVC